MTKTSLSRDSVFYALLALVFMAPLPFGGILPSAWLPMAMASGLLLAAFALTRLKAGETPPVSLRAWRIPLGLLALAMAWGFLQTLPAFSPGMAHPAWQMASEATGVPLTGRISINPGAGRDILLRWMANLAVFWLALNYGRKSGNTRAFLRTFLLSATACAVYGLWVEGNGSAMVLGIAKIQYKESLTGIFINKNHAATFLGLGILCGLSLLASTLASIPSTLGRREKIHMIGHALSGWNALPAACLALLVPALFLTDSRAGVALTLLASLFLIVAARLTKSISRTTFLMLLGLALLPVLGFLLLGNHTNLAQRFGFFGQDWAIRMNIYEITLQALGHTPFAGTGLGTFPDIFRMYHNGLMDGAVTQAHNTYLELALELGIPATLLLLAAGAWPLAICACGMAVRQKNRILPATGMALALLAGLHSALDFSLQMPGLALAFWALMGACTAQGWSMRKSI
ncbi:MAG TPA: hypothetical protein DCW68_00300 [Rhodospirillaceae bacterium]|nr:MAG: hypothetical protein A2018_01615 [Alphaproteobacteria bacterium GWF2_58_20]HAU28541.1 hypothetical protein [Rhodospirillaceae bacterium]